MIKRRDLLLAASAAVALSRLLQHHLWPKSMLMACIPSHGSWKPLWICARDHAELTAQKKHFAIFFEQKGCPYCAAMHEKNLVTGLYL